MEKISKIIRKSLNIVARYGIIGALRVCFRIVKWRIFHALNGKRDKYVELKVNNYRMCVNLKDKGISRDLFIYGTREADQMFIVKNALKPGMNVLDIGANIGYYVIMESAIIGKEAGIVVYEPSAENCALLKKNIALNDLAGRVEIYNEAVSNRFGISKFYLSEKSNLHTLNPVSYRGSALSGANRDFIDVKTADVYDILGKRKDIGFVRMDIEGHEVEVLAGIARAAGDFRIFPGVLFETHFPKYDTMHHDIGRSLELLFELGYAPKYIASSDERVSKIREKGYKPTLVVSTDRVERGIYEGVSGEAVIDLLCNRGGVRAVLLERNE